jgi:hypothetical protein
METLIARLRFFSRAVALLSERRTRVVESAVERVPPAPELVEQLVDVAVLGLYSAAAVAGIHRP